MAQTQITFTSSGGITVQAAVTRDAGGSWISARDNCVVKSNRTSSQGADWHPVLGFKTQNGFWSLGSVGGETLAFSYDLDSNYPNTNAATVLYIPATAGTIFTTAGGTFTGNITAPAVYGAVWNDLADCIEVPEDTVLEPGYCYCSNGTIYYKSTKYLDDGIIGIHSDTFNFKIGVKETKTLDIAVAGFVLAYVDKEYRPGTPLTCSENGWLTELKEEDFSKGLFKIVGTYYKPELSEIWGTSDRKVQVNGRHWIKVK